MPTKKNKFRDLKPTKDAKGGGGGGKLHQVQGAGSVDGGRGGVQAIGIGKGSSKIVDPTQTEGGHGVG